jgi:8-oxo-dGTP pyrophosphatase MutT (NUDIX family)
VRGQPGDHQRRDEAEVEQQHDGQVAGPGYAPIRMRQTSSSSEDEPGRAGSVAYVTDPHKWVIHGERVVDDTPHIRVSLADVELPNHVRFTQYVFRMRRCAMTAVLDDPGDRVLLMRRHRFIVDRWVWELPGGYVDDGEDPAAAAAREVEEETGWRPRGVEYVMSCQPIIGNADYPQDLYLARGAERVGEPEIDEAAEVRWVPVDETPGMIAKGDILGAITIIAVQHVLLRRAGVGVPLR